MSIRQCLADRVTEQAVFEIKPLIPVRNGQPRSVWAEKFVFEQLDPNTATGEYELEAGRLRRKLEGIASGKRVVVGNRRDKTCEIKRLDPHRHEVWEIRERPNPGIRIFFRFIEKDCIAATNLQFVYVLFSLQWTRKGYDFWPIWLREIRRCKAIWRRLFLTNSPHSGVTLNDYISNGTGSGSF